MSATIAWATATILVAFLSDGRHAATVWPLLAFHGSFFALALLALPAPRSQVYTALALLLTLGYWPKFVVRLFSPADYIEPIGSFDGSPAAWDRALLVAAIGSSGVVLARVVQLALARRRPTPPAELWVPPLYARYRVAIWGAALIVMSAAYAYNSWAAVYVTGVNPRVILPLSGNVVLAWCYLMAFPVGLSLLIGWELGRRGDDRLSWGLLAIATMEAAVNAASLLSRATYLLHLAPYLLARTVRTAFTISLPRPTPVALGVMVLGFAASVGIVMIGRAMVYFEPAPTIVSSAPAVEPAPQEPVPADPLPVEPPEADAATRPPRDAIREVSTLFVDRWTGLEGVLVVTSAPVGPGLLADILVEDPALGTRAIYQQLALATYEEDAELTFLTLAGIVAVLAAGGQPWLVLVGMALLTWMLMAAEGTLRRITGNELACATLAVLACFITTQVTFPRLYAVFLLELWVTLGTLAVVVRMLRQRVSSPTPVSVSSPSA